MIKYSLEFILNTFNTPQDSVKASLAEFVEDLQVIPAGEAAEGGKIFKVNLTVEDPTLVFDICAQFGRIKSVKIDEKNAP